MRPRRLLSQASSSVRCRGKPLAAVSDPISVPEALCLSLTELAPKRTGSPTTRIGVGIDTSRYGHYAAPSCATTSSPPPPEHNVLRRIRQRLLPVPCASRRVGRPPPPPASTICLDEAGPYADNLLHFLHHLADRCGPAASPLAGRDITVSCGDPQRNKSYRAALFGAQKSDAVEARACARFAISERPAGASLKLAPTLRVIRPERPRGLQAVVRQRTRLINQLHYLLVPAFPELALIVKDISLEAGCSNCSTATPPQLCWAKADDADLANIPTCPKQRIAELLAQARSSIASLGARPSPVLVRDQVRQLRDVNARQQRLEEGILVTAYRGLPTANHLDSIKGIGDVTAAVLTAFILDIKRFATPNKLVACFARAARIEMSSGIDREGQPRSRAALRHEQTRQRPGAALPVDGSTQRDAVQPGSAVAVPARGGQAPRSQGHCHRSMPCAASPSGVRRMRQPTSRSTRTTIPGKGQPVAWRLARLK